MKTRLAFLYAPPIAVALIGLAGFALDAPAQEKIPRSASGPAGSEPGPVVLQRREWPASVRDTLALDALNARGEDLAKRRRALDDEQKAHQVVYEAAVAEIRSSCPFPLARADEVRFDPSTRKFFVLGQTLPASSTKAYSGMGDDDRAKK